MPNTLLRDLQQTLQGPVSFSPTTRSLYATDASNYRQIPIGVVQPRSAADVTATLEICRHHDVPVLPRGAGTSLAGQAVNAAVVLDFSRHLNRVLEIDPERRLARVEPGCVLDDLRRAAAAHGLTFGPDPSTHAWCTLGGMLGNNACGVHSVMAGRTSDNVRSLEVLTYRGERLTAGATDDAAYAAHLAAGGFRAAIHRALRGLAADCGDEVRRRYPKIPRRVSGYNLDDLLPEHGFHLGRALVGSEGTCAVVLEATLELVPARPERVLLAVAYNDPFAAADHVPEILAAGPIGLEGLEARLLDERTAGGRRGGPPVPLPAGGGWLLAEFGADDRAEAAGAAQALAERLRGAGQVTGVSVVDDPKQQARLWAVREAALATTARTPDGRPTHSGWEDSAVPPERLGAYMRQLRDLLARHGLTSTFYGHFGDGCLHSKIDFDLASAAGRATYRRFVDEALDLVLAHGGVASGEHGDGQARGELLPRLYGPQLADALRRFKTAWDPDGRLNPGKVVDPYPILDHLAAAAPPATEPETVFTYADDGGRFSTAVGRCVGVGKCVRPPIPSSAGTMCPSFRATGDETHSTRGRAHLLAEMLRGEVLDDGWRSEEVRAALDLCLACKACKSECPAGVDMATYKAELLHHHFAGRPWSRPRAAWSMAHVATWARWAAKAPRLVNAVAAAPVLSTLVKTVGGIARERPLPRFAPRTFRQQLGERPAAASGDEPRPPVLLWPDTFTNHFEPRIGLAAADVLEAAGFAVSLPRRPLCCGRPLYDFGFLATARRRLAEVLDALAPEIDAGVPLVGLEPSCVAVFRDELPALFPDDGSPRGSRAHRLAAQTHTLAELLTGGDADLSSFRRPASAAPAVLHPHCHQRAVLGTAADAELLATLEVDATVPDSGCCGMAGAFGFESRKVELSKRVAGLSFLPALAAAPPQADLVIDGFSCRRQTEHLTDRRPLHLAELLRRALP